MATSTQRVTYGNLTIPKSKGLLGLSMTTFLALLVGIVFVMFIYFIKWWAGLLAAVLLVLAILPTVIPGGNGRTAWEVFMLKRGQRKAKKAKSNILLNGPAGKTPLGDFRLPGIGAQSEVSDFRTGFGTPFALVSIPSTAHHSVVLEVHPTGNELVDQSRIDSQVAHWGGWLAYLGTSTGIVGASVVVETSIDSGLRLRRSVLSSVDENASDFGQATAGELAKGFGQATPAISTRVTITWTGKENGRKRSREEMATEISNVLPSLIDGLQTTGAGSSVRPCTSQDLTDYVRSAYDPTVASDIEEQRAQGGTGLTWDQAGPAFHATELGHYYHDRAVSVSWTLGGQPKGTFYDTSLARLLAPERKVARKRVALLYRPIPAERATLIADRRVRNANFVARNAKTNTAVANSAQRAAQQMANEEAAGAGITLFGMVVTATVLDEEDLPSAKQMIMSQSAQARLRMRVALGSQDTAFVAGLPLGIVLPEHTTIPASITDNMI